MDESEQTGEVKYWGEPRELVTITVGREHPVTIGAEATWNPNLVVAPQVTWSNVYGHIFEGWQVYHYPSGFWMYPYSWPSDDEARAFANILDRSHIDWSRSVEELRADPRVTELSLESAKHVDWYLQEVRSDGR